MIELWNGEKIDYRNKGNILIGGEWKGKSLLGLEIVQGISEEYGVDEINIIVLDAKGEDMLQVVTVNPQVTNYASSKKGILKVIEKLEEEYERRKVKGTGTVSEEVGIVVYIDNYQELLNKVSLKGECETVSKVGKIIKDGYEYGIRFIISLSNYKIEKEVMDDKEKGEWEKAHKKKVVDGIIYGEQSQGYIFHCRTEKEWERLLGVNKIGEEKLAKKIVHWGTFKAIKLKEEITIPEVVEKVLRMKKDISEGYKCVSVKYASVLDEHTEMSIKVIDIGKVLEYNKKEDMMNYYKRGIKNLRDSSYSGKKQEVVIREGITKGETKYKGIKEYIGKM